MAGILIEKGTGFREKVMVENIPEELFSKLFYFWWDGRLLDNCPELLYK